MHSSISSQTFLYYLKDFFPVANIPCEDTLEDVKLLSECHEPYEKHILYIADYSLIEKQKNIPDHLLLCSVSTVQKRTAPTEHFCICLKKPVSPADLCLFLARRILSFKSWISQAQELVLKNAALEELLDLFSTQLPYPAIIIDYGMSSISCTTRHDPDLETEAFQMVQDTGIVPPDVVRSPEHSTITRRLFESGTTVITKAIHNKKHFNAYRAFKTDQQMSTSACVFLGSGLGPAGLSDIMEAFFRVLDYYFQSHYLADTVDNQMYEYFLNNLIKKKQQLNDPTFRQRMNYMDLPLHGHFILMRFRFYEGSDIPVQYYVRILRQSIPDIRPFIVSNTLCILYQYQEDYPQFQAIQTRLRRAIANALLNRKYHCYISHPFSVINEIYDAWIQCTFLNSYITAENSGAFFDYEDYSVYHIASLISSGMALTSFAHPAYLFLKEYDQQHHTKHCRFLFTYYENGRSIKHMSAETGKHRNSISQHLQRIQKLLPDDLESETFSRNFMFAALLDLYADAARSRS